MLEKVDLTRNLTKQAAQPQIATLQERLRILQYAALSSGVATTVVLEGWDAAGKGLLVSKLVEKLDPRGFKVRATYAALQEELYRPWLWRFWMKLPANGEIVVFDRSWYGRVLIERIEEIVGPKNVELAFQEIVDFERTLVDDGQVLVKLFRHISKKEQRRRFEKCEKDPHTRWKIKPEDWHHEQYAEYSPPSKRCSSAPAPPTPWAVVGHRQAMGRVGALTRIVEAIEARLKALNELHPAASELKLLPTETTPVPVSPTQGKAGPSHAGHHRPVSEADDQAI